MQKHSRLRKIICCGLTSITFLLPIGCKTVDNYINNSPLIIITESTSQLLNNPDLTEIYKNYFPSNKPELSYKFETKKSKTRFFTNPRLSFREEFNYGLTIGIETKY